MKNEENQEDFFASESEPLAREGQPPLPIGEVVEEQLFNWNDGEDIVVHEQRALAVYENKFGGIVIRQERSWDDEDDTFIVLASPGAAYRLVEAIQNQLNAQKQRRRG